MEEQTKEKNKRTPREACSYRQKTMTAVGVEGVYYAGKHIKHVTTEEEKKTSQIVDKKKKKKKQNQQQNPNIFSIKKK